jgi:hypothetical protein
VGDGGQVCPQLFTKGLTRMDPMIPGGVLPTQFEGKGDEPQVVVQGLDNPFCTGVGLVIFPIRSCSPGEMMGRAKKLS